MGSKKKTQQNTNQFQYMTAPLTAQQQRYADAGKNVDLKTPIISAYGNMERDIKEGAYDMTGLPADLQTKARYGRMFGLNQQKGVDLSNATAQEHQLSLGHLANVASMNAPQLVQTGSNIVTKEPYNWSNLLMGGSQLAMA